MPIRECPAETIIVDYICDVDECGGRVTRDSNQSTRMYVAAVLTPHICETCGETYEFVDKTYPTTYHRPLETSVVNIDTVLPDDSAFFTTETPLPKDHWLYSEAGTPPMLLGRGVDDPEIRAELQEAVRQGVQYSLKVSGLDGSESVDPDAIVQNAIIGIVGYFTPDGTNTTSYLKPADE